MTVDSQKELVTVTGTMDLKEMIPYLNEKLKRNVEVVPPKKDDAGAEKKEGGEKDGGKKEGEGKASGGEKKEGDGKASGGEKKEGDAKAAAASGGEKQDAAVKVDVNKMEYNGYGYPPPPQYWYGAPPMYSQAVYHAEEPSHWYGGHMPVPVYEGGHVAAPVYSGDGPSHHYAYPMQHVPPPQMFSDENPNACSVM